MKEALKFCPELQVLPYEYDEIEKASEELFRVVLSVSRRVVPVSCDEVKIFLCQEVPCSSAAEMERLLFTTRLLVGVCRPTCKWLWQKDDSALSRGKTG